MEPRQFQLLAETQQLLELQQQLVVAKAGTSTRELKTVEVEGVVVVQYGRLELEGRQQQVKETQAGTGKLSSAILAVVVVVQVVRVLMQPQVALVESGYSPQFLAHRRTTQVVVVVLRVELVVLVVAVRMAWPVVRLAQQIRVVVVEHLVAQIQAVRVAQAS